MTSVPDRVVSIFVDTYVVDPELFRALDKTFPALETFSLVFGLLECPDREFLFSPENFAAAHLRTLYLKNVKIENDDIFDVPTLSLLFTSVSTSLVYLHLEDIEGYSYLSPGELAERISSMPRLERMFIRLSVDFRLADIESGFLDIQIARTVLHNLRELTFEGDSAYLDKLLALISTPSSSMF